MWELIGAALRNYLRKRLEMEEPEDGEFPAIPDITVNIGGLIVRAKLWTT